VKESKSVQQETLKHFLRSTDMPRSLNAATAGPVIFLTIYRRTANAKNVRARKMNEKQEFSTKVIVLMFFLTVATLILRFITLGIAECIKIVSH